MCVPGYFSLPSSDFPRHPSIALPERKAERLCDLSTGPELRSNSDLWVGSEAFRLLHQENVIEATLDSVIMAAVVVLKEVRGENISSLGALDKQKIMQMEVSAVKLVVNGHICQKWS